VNLAICPHCASPLQPLQSASIVTLSCPVCGWNCSSARHVWKRHMLLGRLFLLFGLAILVTMIFVSVDIGTALVIAALFFVIGGVIYGTSWKALRALRPPKESQKLKASGKAVEAFTKLIPRREEVEARFPGVLNVARPRPTKWTWRTWASVLLLPGWLLVVSIDHKTGRVAAIDALVGLVGFCILFGKLEVQTFKDWRLLRIGEATTGRVIAQQSIVSGRYPSSIIFYAFMDAANRPFIGEAHDPTQKIKEGEPLIVFHGLSNPNRSVVLDGYNFTMNTLHNAATLPQAPE
jgi:hypothetical protein